MRYLSRAPALRVHSVRAGAAIVLFLGYADLVNGGVTGAPVLLVVGYLLLVPAVILTWR
ncbi:MAG: hypothetical protein JWM95_2457 [Gemmatimonadetes bacterium]|nr:hypothetical protein [Gemmatimonadota bacterium]